MNTKPLILIIDDEPAILKTLKDALEDETYRVKTLDQGLKALDVIGDLVPDLILLDIFMPNCNGLDLLQQIKKEFPQQKVVMISGYGNIPIALEAIKKGALDFIEKPLNLDEVLSKIEHLTTTKGQLAQGQKLPNKISPKEFGLAGESPLFLELINHVQHLASLKHPLLIYGLTGTGKTLIARYTHHCSTQDTQPFITINCSTPLEDFEQTLASLATGTIFFKNINDLGEDQQKILLSFLNSEQYKTRNAQGLIKIIASSYRSLFKLSLEHKFNYALLHKLNITPIELVPLNKRRYDIPLLCDYFLNQSNKRHQKTLSLSTQSIRFLRNHSWSGNITELRTLIETLVAQTPQQAGPIDTASLQNYLHEKNIQFVEEQSFLHFNSLQEATEHFERHFLTYALKKSSFNIEHVSDKLKISQLDLQNKISKLDIQLR